MKKNYINIHKCKINIYIIYYFNDQILKIQKNYHFIKN